MDERRPYCNASAPRNNADSFTLSPLESQFFPCGISEYLISIRHLSIRYHYMIFACILIGVRMESLDQIVQRMEAPIAFASEGAYSRLSQVKNLEMVMISLLRQLKEVIRNEGLRSRKDQLDALSDELLSLFGGYDALTEERKRDRLARAAPLLSSLKTLLISLNGTDHQIGHRRAPERSGPDILTESVQFIQGVGPRIASLLAKKNLSSIEDLLYFIPRRYEDRRIVSRIAETVPRVRQTVVGRIAQADSRYYGNRRIFEAHVDDGSGILKAKWFKGREAFLKGTFRLEARVILTGEVTGFPFDREMIHPDFEILNEQDDQLLHFKRIVPIYSETEGLHQKTLRRILWKVVRDFSHLLESPIPEEICQRRNLIEIRDAIRHVHFPGNDQAIDAYQEVRSDAHRRLIYDEFFFFQLGMALKKKGESLERGIPFRIKGQRLSQFYPSC
jgi:ATP-dependent DNA helicase RecG